MDPGLGSNRPLVVNDPDMVREIEAAFAGYTKAIGDNDVAALDGYFYDSPVTVRFGYAENLYGYAAIKSFRAAVVPSGQAPQRERTVITTFGRDFATVSTLTRSPRPGKVGRTMQSWVRVAEGWRIVAAHVSMMDEPAS